MRLLRKLNRFSEDLDFDSINLTATEINQLVKTVVKSLVAEKIDVVLYYNKTDHRDYFELRFPTLLFNLGLSQSNEEKLVIKLDFENWWQGQNRELVFLNRYGLMTNIVTKSTDQVIVEKLTAYLKRRETQPRDIYDIVWLVTNGAKVDFEFAQKNKLSANLVQLAQNKFIHEKKHLNTFKTKLVPFLLDEKDTHKLDFFEQVLAELRRG